MLEDKLINVNIEEAEALVTPQELLNKIPADEFVNNFIYDGRNQVRDILDGKDKRVLMIAGPCSIHDVNEALDYAKQLKVIADSVKDKILIVMRTYFEKPRTRLGWTGLLCDPDIDGSGNIQKGMELSRQLLLDISKLGLLTATEFLTAEAAQYYGDLISYAAIGARTVESPNHRHMASGLSMPVGMKNGTCGSIDKAIDAVVTARSPHVFFGPNMEGERCRLKTKGNPYAHLILRGGKDGPNYTQEYVDYAIGAQKKAGIDMGIIVDASHANSGKDPSKQPDVVYSVVEQKKAGKHVVGVMVESNLLPGSQKIQYPLRDRSSLKPGLSITYAGLGIEEYKKMINQIYDSQ
jgi:3-deoxy-7-phosphoheptulonate synthase